MALVRGNIMRSRCFCPNLLPKPVGAFLHASFPHAGAVRRFPSSRTLCLSERTARSTGGAHPRWIRHPCSTVFMTRKAGTSPSGRCSRFRSRGAIATTATSWIPCSSRTAAARGSPSRLTAACPGGSRGGGLRGGSKVCRASPIPCCRRSIARRDPPEFIDRSP